MLAPMATAHIGASELRERGTPGFPAKAEVISERGAA